MADEMPTARGFSSGSQGSWEGAPRLRGADVLVPCCWSLRNTSEWQGPASSGPFLSLKSVCAEDRKGRQDSPTQSLVPSGCFWGPGGLGRGVMPAPSPAGPRGTADCQGQAVLVASLNFRSFSL